MDLVSKILIHKLGPNHVGIGSRTERSRVLLSYYKGSHGCMPLQKKSQAEANSGE